MDVQTEARYGSQLPILGPPSRCRRAEGHILPTLCPLLSVWTPGVTGLRWGQTERLQMGFSRHSLRATGKHVHHELVVQHSQALAWGPQWQGQTLRSPPPPASTPAFTALSPQTAPGPDWFPTCWTRHVFPPEPSDLLWSMLLFPADVNEWTWTRCGRSLPTPLTIPLFFFSLPPLLHPHKIPRWML